MYKSLLIGLYFVINSKDIFILFGILKRIYYLFFTKLEVVIEDCEVLFISHSNLREDLEHDLTKVQDLLNTMGFNTRHSQILVSHLHLYIPSLTTLNSARALMYELLANTNREVNFIGNVYLYIRAVEAIKFSNISCNIISQSSVQNFVFSQEMECRENIFASVINQCGRKSFALQHGYYNDEGPDVNEENINSINYLASVCKYILVWGESTRKLFAHYRPDAFTYIIGKPISGVDMPLDNKPVVDIPCIIFDSKDRVDGNLVLDKLCTHFEENEIEFCAKAHPDDTFRRNKYKDIHKICDINYQKVFGCHSSLLLEQKLIKKSVYVLANSRLRNITESCSTDCIVLPFAEFVQLTDAEAEYHTIVLSKQSLEPVSKLFRR